MNAFGRNARTILFGAVLALAPVLPEHASAIEFDPVVEAEADSVLAELDAGFYAEGRILAEALSSRVGGEFDPGSAEVALAARTLAAALYRARDLADGRADSLARYAIGAFEALEGTSPGGEETANSLVTLQRILAASGDLGASIEVGGRAIDLFDAVLGSPNDGTSRASEQVAVCYARQGRFGEAREYFLASYDANRDLYGAHHERVGLAAMNLGSLDYVEGNYRAAQERYREAVDILREHMDPDHPQLLAGVYNLANVSMRAGDFGSARRGYERAIAGYRSRLGPDHPKLANALAVYGNLERQMGNYSIAERSLREAVRIYEVAAPETQGLAVCLTNLGETLVEVGEPADALAAYVRATELHTRTVGADAPDAISSRLNEAVALEALGRLDEAAAVCRTGLPRLAAALGPDHPTLVSYYLLLGRIELERGDDSPAIAALRSGLEIGRQQSPHHPRLAGGQVLLGDALWEEGRVEEAFEHWELAARALHEHTRRTAQTLTEGETLRLRHKWSGAERQLLAHLDADSPPEHVRIAWDAVVRNRSLVLDELAARSRILHASTDPELDALYEDLTQARVELSNLFFASGDPDAAAIEAALQIEEALESRMARSFPDYVVPERAGIGTIVSALGRDEALVSYTRFGEGEDAGYVALVAGGPDQRLSALQLGPAREIDVLLGQWRREMSDPSAGVGALSDRAESSCRERGAVVRERLWDPVMELCPDATRVHVVPDGAVLTVNLLALPQGDEGYLVDGGSGIAVLSHEGDLLSGGDGDRVAMTAALLMGAPEYGPPSEGDPEFAARGLPCIDVLDHDFVDLPGAKAEIEEVAERLPNVRKQVATGADATESMLKASAQGYAIIHLATHGFYLGGDCGEDRGQPQEGRGPSARRDAVGSRNPLLTSGLAFAGANDRRDPEQPGEDGILSAEEASALDLRSTSLVVVSACESGVGAIQSGAGVAGFRRAFASAGAGQLVSALWAVDDRSTRELMSTFYDYHFGQGLSVGDALSSAQREFLRSRRSDGASTHPYFWAGFVACRLGN